MIRSFSLLLCALILLDAGACGADTAPDAVYVPPDAGVVDVKAAYGAKGDGRTDDTAALQRALQEHVGSMAVIYLPPGTFLVSGTLDWVDAHGVPNAFLRLQGAGRGRTTIRLADHCAGFADPAAPKAVVMTRSQKIGGNDGSNQAHENYLMDFAVEVGAGNPGAIGVDFMASNTGAMVRVDVRAPADSGTIGLALTRGFGPGLVQDVRIAGFATGIAITGMIYSATLERIHLEGQRTVGLDTRENTVSVNHLVSVNRCPAVRQHANQPLTGWLGLLDCSFTGGDRAAVAIENESHLLVRDLTVSGYAAALVSSSSSGATRVEGPQVREWLSGAASVSPLGGPGTTLRLPVEESPEHHETDAGRWASVVTAGAVPDDRFDDSDAIQQAIDSGATTVYFPHGTYHLTAPVVVRGKVRRLVGYGTRIEGKKAGCDIRLEVPAIIEHLDLLGTARFINTAKALATLRFSVAPVLCTAEAGGWYLDDVCTGPLAIGTGQRIVARQLNDEYIGDEPGIANRGGSLWVLGLKAEGGNTCLLTSDGGSSEILGAHLYACQTWRSGTKPAFIVKDGRLTAGVAMICHWQPANFNQLLDHTQGGRSAAIAGSGHAAWPLLSAGPTQ